MPIVLTRIDDRLIHGQITEGWCKSLNTELIVVVSDDVVSSDWEKELCLAALPSNIEGMVVSIDEAPEIINKLVSDPRNSYVIFETPHDAYTAHKKGAGIHEINVGGMHSSKDKREILDYIFVDEEDTKYLRALNDSGVTLDFRDMPNNVNVDVLSQL
ncbi:PTS system mannose/fructose/N-acetylgalactosamine-transporter subunit IIB [Candidatus Latescibacterota bacterium]